MEEKTCNYLGTGYAQVEAKWNLRHLSCEFSLPATLANLLLLLA